MENINFEVGAKAARLIGRENIADVDGALIELIKNAYDADAYFPNLDEKPEWEITADSDEQTYFDLEFYFYKYERR